MAGTPTEITGIICGGDGSVIGGATIRASVQSTEQDQGGQVAGSAGVTSEAIEAFTTDSGTFSICLLAGATMLLEIPAINLRKNILVPASGPVDFTTLV
jgi:hypothetical protein